MEGQERDRKNRDETVNAGALVWGENLPPPDRAVGQNHGHVKRKNRG